MKTCGPSGDEKLDVVSWEKTKKEMDVKTLLGPYSLNNLPDGVRLLPRRPIWECHGGGIEDSFRNIDDALAR